MNFDNQIVFKIADELYEFDQIHELTYSTFVDEIPQHAENNSRVLVDKFHDQNTYIVCLKNSELIGMIAVRDKRPFSLDHKLENLGSYLPDSDSICEIRLLSIKKKHRSRKILSGLFSLLADFCEKNNYDLALISATTRELRLYKKLGFKEFGPLVGEEGAYYQPMFLTPSSYLQFKNETNILRFPETRKEKIFLLPGPVKVSEKVKRAFESTPISHRSDQFLNDFNLTKKMLSELSGAKSVEIFMGSGTLANDVVAGQLSALNQRGIVLSNGHFGERLFDHAKRFSLSYIEVKKEWGSEFDLEDLQQLIVKSKPAWIWFVHNETSTGQVNDLDSILKISLANNVKVCVDCVSSIGSFDFDLRKVYLASGVSGKALASYPGLSFVFYNHEEVRESENLPKYIDLGFYKSNKGVPFTISSNILYALKTSIERIDLHSREIFISKVNKYIKDFFAELGLEIYGRSNSQYSNVITVRLPGYVNSVDLGNSLESKGIYISYKSQYLIDNNLIQIALMGEVDYSQIEKFKDCFRQYKLFAK